METKEVKKGIVEDVAVATETLFKTMVVMDLKWRTPQKLNHK